MFRSMTRILPRDFIGSTFNLFPSLSIPIRSVADYEELHGAHSLLYREYQRRTYCAQNKLGAHFTAYSFLPTTECFVWMQGDKCRATLSVIADSPAGIPLEDLYGEEVAELRRQGRKLVEYGQLALDSRNFRRNTYSMKSLTKARVLFSLFKAAYVHTKTIIGATDIVIVVHPRHEAIYKYMGFEQFGPVRNYKGAEGNLALPLRLNLEKVPSMIDSSAIVRFMEAPQKNAKPSSRLTVNATWIAHRLLNHPRAWFDASDRLKDTLIAAIPELATYLRNATPPAPMERPKAAHKVTATAEAVPQLI